jgi:Predicted esterase of the alpha-beta hydrolase superfamily
MLRAGNLGYAMQASCAVPSLRKPVEIEGQLFCDGGTVCNLPVKQCRELGADVIIAINVDEPFVPLPLSHFRKIGSVTKRYIDWSLYEIDEAQSAMADITIHPDTSEISLISTKRKDAMRALKSGEEEARRMLPQIRRLLTEKGIPIYGVTK